MFIRKAKPIRITDVLLYVRMGCEENGLETETAAHMQRQNEQNCILRCFSIIVLLQPLYHGVSVEKET